MAELVAQPALQQVGRPLSLIPVGLKEAALDSPTFRATAVHFSDQVEIIERWLEAYVKSTSKLVHDVGALEDTINTFLARSVPPANISEAVLDHDYTYLAMKRFGEGASDWWSHIMSGMKKMDTTIVDPVKAFMSGELRNFKDARRYLEQSQKVFDSTLSKYLSQSKTKEASALREDAFQVHEARRAYLKASLDFCLLAPQLRSTIDKLLVKVSAESWREMKKARDLHGTSLGKHSLEIERVRGWCKEMEAGESIFRKELQVARREIGESVTAAFKPSRELDDYSTATVASLGSKGPTALNVHSMAGHERSEKQGWLYVRTTSGKPARNFWVRRWYYVKNGIFGWLVTQAGGVEESERIGVLLCSIKAAVSEDRRFCFEVKTKNTSILLQAETQAQLMEWLATFDIAKRDALEASAGTDYSQPRGLELAFAITQPQIPEFAATDIHPHDEQGGGLVIPSDSTVAARGSFDVSNPRKSVAIREDGESGRDHAARIIQKLDSHRKTMLGTGESQPGGIASLISASHNILPAYSTPAITQMGPSAPGKGTTTGPQSMEDLPSSSLAPATFANPPASTNLSKSAVILSGERGIGIGISDATGGMPSGMMANLWGSSNWGYINRLERPDFRTQSATSLLPAEQPSPSIRPVDASSKPGGIENVKLDSGLPAGLAASISTTTDPTDLPQTSLLLKDAKADIDNVRFQPISAPKPESYPGNYPPALKLQEAQFRMLFPNVGKDEKLVLVFRATWNPNDHQEFPGRVYVTPKTMYFYSHHLGLVLISGVGLDSIEEATAAPGKDCDFIFLHLREQASRAGYTRITIKTFLEPLRLLQARLNYLIDARHNDDHNPLSLEELVVALIKIEREDPSVSPSLQSWEDVDVNTPIDDGTASGRRREKDLRATIHVEKGLHLGKGITETKFQLPSHPIVYEPENMDRKAIERNFNVSPKALFHVLFGDKSAVFQLLYHERRAQRIAQGPWTRPEQGPMRRDFHFQIDYLDMFRRHRQANVVDYQVIDVLNDHVCYVVTDKKTPWHLPHHEDFMLTTKVVITFLAKSKCKLAIFNKVEWSKAPTFSRGLVERQALDDLSLDAADLADVIADQVRKLGAQGHTKKAIQVFGHVGQQTSVSLFSAADKSISKRPQIKQRTLTSMLYETTSSLAESVASSLMLWSFAVLKKIWTTLSAHRMLLVALLVSSMANLYFSGKDTSEWWAEKNAAGFMSRIGVGPNNVMSRAIYLQDLDELVMESRFDELGDSNSHCYSAFKDIANATDIDAHYHTAGTTFSAATTKSTARRLRRTRQHLGSYRHDLMVAMRVVNNVEREMLRAEWENWLLDENSRCKQADSILRQENTELSSQRRSKGKTEAQQGSDAQTKERQEQMQSLREWQERYCGSCQREQDLLVTTGRDLASR